MTDTLMQRLANANERTVKSDLLDLIGEVRSALQEAADVQEHAVEEARTLQRRQWDENHDLLECLDPEDEGSEPSEEFMLLFDRLGRAGGIPAVKVTMEAYFFRTSVPTRSQVMDWFANAWNHEDTAPCGTFNGVPRLDIEVEVVDPVEVTADGSYWGGERPGVMRA